MPTTLSTATSHIQTSFRKNHLLQALAVWYAGVWIVTAIHPVFPADWLMENVLVALFVAGLALTYHRFPLSDLSYILPALTLGVIYLGTIARLTRGGMLDALGQDFIRTARADRKSVV